MFPAEACTDLANALSKGIDSLLGMGIRGEVSGFEAGTQALGFASCPGIVCPTGGTLASCVGGLRSTP